MEERKYKCDHPGCDKAFNRRDYLYRHAQNHMTVLPFQCQECPQKFARADLLEKHLNTKSHEKRRKREAKQKLQQERTKARKLKQEKRAEKEREKEQEKKKDSSEGSSGWTDASNEYTFGGNNGYYGATDAEGLRAVDQSNNAASSDNYLFASFPATLPDEFGNVDFLNNTGPSNIDSNVSGNYAWLFGKEFLSDRFPNMASSAYDYLTNVTNEGAMLMPQQMVDVPQQHHHQQNLEAPPPAPLPPLPFHHQQQQQQQQQQQPFPPSPQLPPQQVPPVVQQSPVAQAALVKEEQFPGTSDYLGSRIDVNASLLRSFTEQKQQKRAAKLNQWPQFGEPLMNATRTVYTQNPADKNSAVKHHVFGRTYNEQTSSGKEYNAKKLSQAHLFIDEPALASVQGLIDECTKLVTSRRQGTAMSQPSPQFSAQTLSYHLDLYWSNFDPLYPIIHKPTFVARTAHPELLLSMAIVGMAYANDPDSYKMATRIYTKMRIIILAMLEDNEETTPVWIHQCLLLINYFVIAFGSQSMVDLSQVYHGSHVALLKLSGYLKDLEIPKIPENYASLDVQEFWDRYIAFETKKRTALFAFICDTQQAVFFRHTLGLSSFELNLEMPCSDACWEAPTPDTFIQIYRVQPRHLQLREPPGIDEIITQTTEVGTSNVADKTDEEDEDAKSGDYEPLMGEVPIPTQGNWPTLLFSMRRLMSRYHESQREYPLECYSAFSRFILLHCLLNISWEMQWRGILDTGIVSKRRMQEFKTRLVVAFTSWKGYFDRQLRKLNTPELNRIITGDGSSSSTATPVFEDVQPITAATAFPYHLTPQTIELNNYSNTLMLCSNWAMFYLGLIVLYEDTFKIRQYSKLVHYTLDPARLTVDQLQARQYVLDWVKTLDARWATWHSMHFLQRIFTNELLIHQADSLPWCTFIATLTLWSYDAPRSESNTVTCKDYLFTDHTRQSGFSVNSDLARRDALQYMELVKQSPPKSLAASSPYSTASTRHDGDDEDDDDTNAVVDPDKRTKYVIAIVCYSYHLLQRFDRTGGQFLQDLYEIMVQFN